MSSNPAPSTSSKKQKSNVPRSNGGGGGGVGGGGGGGGNKNQNLRKLSHSLSWALRHAAPELGLTMTSDGFVPVSEILASKHPKLKGWSLKDIQSVVETSDKQRFKLEERPAAEYKTKSPAAAEATAAAEELLSPQEMNDMVMCIRANQGHTVKTVDPEKLLTRLEVAELETLPVIVHGTYTDPWTQHIRQEGLKRMNRQHIHCATGLPTDDGVISGLRKSCNVYVFIDAAKCATDGIVFYRSDNGVLLTAGVNNEGNLPVEYFSHVMDKSETILLDQRDKAS
jgi:2'-phosphotransferase